MSVNKLELNKMFAISENVNFQCSRCSEIVCLGADLNDNLKWFTLNGTNFCGPKGRLSHKVEGI